MSSGGSQQNSPALGKLERMIQVKQSDGMGRGEENHSQPGNANGIVAPGDNTLPLFPLAPSFFPLGGIIHRARHQAQQQQQASEHSLRVQEQQRQAQQSHHQTYLIQQQQPQVQQAPHPAYAANGLYNRVDNRGLTPNMNSSGVYRQPHAQVHHNAQQQQQAWEHSLRVQQQQPQAQQDHRQAYLTQQQQAQVPQAPHPTYAANGMYNGVSNRGLTPNMNFNGGYTGMASASATQLGQLNMQFAPNFSAQIPASKGGVNGHGNGLNLSHVATYGVNASMGGRTRVADRENVVERRRQKRKIKKREASNQSHARKRARTAELEAENTQLKKENDRLKKEIEQMAKHTERLVRRVA